jgi:sigma-B regulation protein RsbU (phosphoserine phosphatase)
MAILDTFHTLSYQGMPYFLIANTDANRATTFWIIARLVGAVGITLGSLIRINKRSKINRNVFLAISLLFSFSVLVVVTYFPNVLPAMYVAGVGITPIKIILEYVVVGFLCFAGILYMRQYLKYKDDSDILFTIAIVISIFSELAFVSYDSVYDIYNYIGHVYKFIAFFIVFRVAFILNIERPYRALYNARNKLRKYSGDLTHLVSERTEELQTANKELNQLNHNLLEDLEYAREIQKAILPDKLPNNERVAFDAKYYPAERVSGDFYNIFRLDESRIGMYIGDVAGHGVPAAMLTVFLNQSIKTTKELDENNFEILRPSKVLENLYELYNRIKFRDEVYILILYAVYDVNTKILTYSSAGLNVEPIVMKKKGAVSRINIKGLPICGLADISKPGYADHTIQLEERDRVFFYTDGLVELVNAKTGESFAVPDLETILTENKNLSNAELFEKIDGKIRGIADSRDLKDDITFFMMQIL